MNLAVTKIAKNDQNKHVTGEKAFISCKRNSEFLLNLGRKGLIKVAGSRNVNKLLSKLTILQYF